jgi:hypothetical protein
LRGSAQAQRLFLIDGHGHALLLAGGGVDLSFAVITNDADECDDGGDDPFHRAAAAASVTAVSAEVEGHESSLFCAAL